MKYYTLEDFYQISQQPHLSYTESAECEHLTQIIDKLTEELGISREYTKPRDDSFASSRTDPSMHRNNGRRRNHSQTHGLESSWIQPKVTFKPTTIEKDKNTAINDIRSCLNKLSAKNYEVSKNSLLETIKKTNRDELPQVAQHIFDIASTNKFFSEIYANIYKEILSYKNEDEDYEIVNIEEQIESKNQDIFRTLLDTFLSNFTETMHTIQYVDAAENYDNFCEYNKRNDKRKATSLFIVNLTKNGVIEPAMFISIVAKILEILQGYMQESGKTNEVEEITENLFLFLTSNVALDDNADEVKTIRDQIALLAKLKAKDRASLSSRAIFKYCDIVEKWK
jgi:hypothetical protein